MSKHKKYTDIECIEIANLYNSGLSIEKISKILNISDWRTRTSLLKWGVKIRPFHKEVTLNHDFFETIDTEAKAYWLGFLTADGCVYKDKRSNSYRISITLQSTDDTHLKKWLDAIGSNLTPNYSQLNTGMCNHTCYTCNVSVSSVKMANDLANKGVIPRKTGKCYPYDISPNLERHYWRGLIDGDGHLSFNLHEKPSKSRNVPIVGLSGDLKMCEGFKLFCAKYTNTNIKICKAYNSNLCHHYVINCANAAIIAHVLYCNSTISLDRKYDKYLKIREFALNRKTIAYKQISKFLDQVIS